MSADGLKWARAQRPSGPGAQLLLVELGLNASDLGTVVDLSIPRLAEVTRQSQRTVSRLLANLEGAGAIERADAHDGSGGRRVIIRLRLDCQLDEPTAAERASMPTSDGEVSDDQNIAEGDEAGPAKLAGPRSRQTAHQVPPNSASGPAKCDTTPLYTNLKESLLNASASAREGEREKIIEFQKRLKEDWKRFAANYPGVAAMDLARGEQELGRLNLGDRDVAIREAAHYAAEIKAAKKTFPKEAWRWIADRDFDRLAEVRQAKAEKAGLKAPLVPVRKGTPAGDRWEASDQRAGKKGYWAWSDEHRCQVSWRATLFPPDLGTAPPPPTEPTAPASRVGADAWKTLASRINPQAVPPEAATGPPDDDIPFE